MRKGLLVKSKLSGCFSKVTDRVITVEYAAREDGEAPSGGRGGSPGRYRGASRGSPPPYGRDRSPARRNRRYYATKYFSFVLVQFLCLAP